MSRNRCSRLRRTSCPSRHCVVPGLARLKRNHAPLPVLRADTTSSRGVRLPIVHRTIAFLVAQGREESRYDDDSKENIDGIASPYVPRHGADGFEDR